jgi:hypothetical protein
MRQRESRMSPKDMRPNCSRTVLHQDDIGRNAQGKAKLRCCGRRSSFLTPIGSRPRRSRAAPLFARPLVLGSGGRSRASSSALPASAGQFASEPSTTAWRWSVSETSGTSPSASTQPAGSGIIAGHWPGEATRAGDVRRLCRERDKALPGLVRHAALLPARGSRLGLRPRVTDPGFRSSIRSCGSRGSG